MTKPKTDLQSIFNRVKRHLLKQNARSVNRGGPKPGCAYRDGGGLKCAAGCLIPNKAYRARIEGSDINNDNVWDLFRKIGYSDACRRLIKRLQEVHDWSLPVVWEEKLRGTALDFGLKYE